MTIDSVVEIERFQQTKLAPWRPWAEGLVGLMLAWGLQHLGVEPPGITLDAIVVVLAAARYGYTVGAGLGLVAACAGQIGAGQAVGNLFQVYTDRSHLALGFTYIAVGAMVGLVGDVPRAVSDRLRDELMRVRMNYTQMEARYRVMMAAKEAVDRRIVGQLQTLTSLYDAAHELESLVPKQILPAMLRLLARFLEVEAASLYMLEGEHLTLVAFHGEATRAETLGPEHPLFAVAARLEPLSVITDEERARSGVYLATPLRYADGRPRGVVAIERLPFHQLTPATRQMLALLADWASRALAKSEVYQEAEEQRRDHPVTRAHRFGFVDERLAQEWNAARRYELPLSVLLVRHPGLDSAEGQAWEDGIMPIVTLLKSRLRNVDVLGHYRTPGAFLLILPVTPADGAKVLLGRLKEALPECLLAVGSNKDGHANAEAMLQAMQAVTYPQAQRAG